MLLLSSAVLLGCGALMGSASSWVKCRKSCKTLLVAIFISVNALVTGLCDRASFLTTRRLATFATFKALWDAGGAPVAQGSASFPTLKGLFAGEMSLERECVIGIRLQICKTAGQRVGTGIANSEGATDSRSNDICGGRGRNCEAGVGLVGLVRRAWDRGRMRWWGGCGASEAGVGLVGSVGLVVLARRAWG